LAPLTIDRWSTASTILWKYASSKVTRVWLESAYFGHFGTLLRQPPRREWRQRNALSTKTRWKKTRRRAPLRTKVTSKSHGIYYIGHVTGCFLSLGEKGSD